jgi:hypothetical protein
LCYNLCKSPLADPPLAALSLPCLSVLAAVKDLGERGIHEFNFEHVFFTYGEFAKARLVGTGKARFGRLVMKDVRQLVADLPNLLSTADLISLSPCQAFNQLAQTAVLFPCQSSTSASAQSFSTSAADYAKHRCAVSPYDIVELFRGPAGKGILSQLSAWGRKFDVRLLLLAPLRCRTQCAELRWPPYQI